MRWHSHLDVKDYIEEAEIQLNNIEFYNSLGTDSTESNHKQDTLCVNNLEYVEYGKHLPV